MKTLMIGIICIAAGFGLAYIIIPSAPSSVLVGDSLSGYESKQLFTCGMHPEIISEEPGYCPICEMKLTPKKDGASAVGSVTIDPVTIQNMGLVTTSARHQKVTRSILAFGKVGYNESSIYSVNLRTEGWVDKVYVTYEGEKVLKGQPLLEVYSPKLVAAQQEYLAIGKSSEGEDLNENLARLQKAARLRLENWDLSESQIEYLSATGEVTKNIQVLSPANGIVVTQKVKEGDHLKPGAEVYRIADLSNVWIVAHVYEQDAPFAAEGRKVQVTFPNLPGQAFEGRVSYVSPFLDAARQLDIRVELDNPDGLLRPDMYAEVDLRSELPGERLVIPRSAVINSGKRQIVYTSAGEGNYQPHEVITGVVGDDDMIEIISGLEHGELVVVSGQFLLDSESRLSEALGGGHAHQHGEMEMPQTEGSHEGHDDAENNRIYTCPMTEHYNILQIGPGKCSECGMNLVPVEETDNTEVYTCPMTQCGVAASEPGRCPVCNMKLIKYEPEAGHDH